MEEVGRTKRNRGEEKIESNGVGGKTERNDR